MVSFQRSRDVRRRRSASWIVTPHAHTRCTGCLATKQIENLRARRYRSMSRQRSLRAATVPANSGLSSPMSQGLFTACSDRAGKPDPTTATVIEGRAE